MLRRLALACVGLALTTATVDAQAPLAPGAIPSRSALRRLDLDLHWSTVVPLLPAERLTSISIDSGFLFAQTTLGNFHAFNAESGQRLWTAQLDRLTTRSFPASVNKTGVYVTNSNHLYALDRNSGRQMWMQTLRANPACPTIASDYRVVVGLESGMVAGFSPDTGKPDWQFGADGPVTSRPQLTNRVMAVGSHDGRVYVTRSDRFKQLFRFETSDQIVAPLSSHGVRTLLIPSMDHSLYAIDLFLGTERWNFASGAPIDQEPLVADQDVYVVNTAGQLSAVDVRTGSPRWTISTLGGRILAVSGTKVYLETHDEDLFVVDRGTGKLVYDPQTTFQRSGVNLRDFNLGITNRTDDRLYFSSKGGLIIALREGAQIKPRYLRDPNGKPFGYIPPEGYPDLAVPTASIPTQEPLPAAKP